MEKIEGIDLKDLVAEASDTLMVEKRRVASNSIKQHLQRVQQLAYDVCELEKELKKKKEKLAKAQTKIDQIREGNWSLLADKDDKKDKSKNQDNE